MRTRILIAVGAFTGLLLVHEVAQVVHLRAAVAAARSPSDRTALAALIAGRAVEVAGLLQWLDATCQSDPQIDCSGGIWRGDRPDADLIRRAVLNTYLPARLAGSSQAEARERVRRSLLSAATPAVR
jgi:hypothetical protein